MKFLTARYTQSSATVSQKSFSRHFWHHLGFQCKLQKSIYLGNGARQSNFDKIFDPQDTHRIICNCLPKFVFSPFLATILNFCIKCKNAFISETVCDGAILMKFLTRRVCTESAVTFAKNCFPSIFTPQPLRAVGVLFSPMVSGWAGGRKKFVRAVSQKP